MNTNFLKAPQSRVEHCMQVENNIVKLGTYETNKTVRDQTILAKVILYHAHTHPLQPLVCFSV